MQISYILSQVLCFNHCLILSLRLVRKLYYIDFRIVGGQNFLFTWFLQLGGLLLLNKINASLIFICFFLLSLSLCWKFQTIALKLYIFLFAYSLGKSQTNMTKSKYDVSSFEYPNYLDSSWKSFYFLKHFLIWRFSETLCYLIVTLGLFIPQPRFGHLPTMLNYVILD